MQLDRSGGGQITKDIYESSPILRCDLSGPTTPLPHFWEHTVGSGRAVLSLRADWQRQLKRCHRELGFRHVRFHVAYCAMIWER